MTATRFEVKDDQGNVVIPNGMMSFPERTLPEEDARFILKDLDQSGWSIRLWKDVDLVGALESLGKPDVELMHR